jgi:hypothetical protein
LGVAMGGAVEPQILHNKTKCVACKQPGMIWVKLKRNVIANLEKSHSHP